MTQHKFKIGDTAYRQPTMGGEPDSFVVAKVGTKWLTGPCGDWDRYPISSCFPTREALEAHRSMQDRREKLYRRVAHDFTWHQRVLEEDVPALEAIFERAGLKPLPR